MNRYIDADVFIRLIKEKYRFNDFLSANSAQKIIDNIPAADVVPVVHAHWVGDGEVPWCSNCKSEIPYTFTGEYDEWYSTYCPACGAIMDEEVEPDE